MLRYRQEVEQYMPNKPREGTVRVTIRLDEDIVNAIQADAEQQAGDDEIITISSWIRSAIEEKLKKSKRKKRKPADTE